MNASELPTTTLSDATLDVVAALDMYAGGFGAEDVTIDKAEGAGDHRVRVTLSNGDVYELRVAAVSRAADDPLRAAGWTPIATPDDAPNGIVAHRPTSDGGIARLHKDGMVDAIDGSYILALARLRLVRGARRVAREYQYRFGVRPGARLMRRHELGLAFTFHAGRLCGGRRGAVLRVWLPGELECRTLGLEARTAARFLLAAAVVALVMLR